MIGFVVIILIMIMAGTYVLHQLNKISDAAKVTLSSDVRAVDLTNHLKTRLYDLEGYGQKYKIAGGDDYFALFKAGTRDFVEHLDSLRQTHLDPVERHLMDEVRRQYEWYDAAVMAGQTTESTADSLKLLHEGLDEIILSNQLSIQRSMASVEASTTRSSQVSLFLTACAIAAALTVAFVLARTITRPIGTLIRGTEKIAGGTFDRIEVESRDEIAQLADAVNDMSGKLKKINEMKSDLLHQISHELRTPLQTILSAHYLLMNQKMGQLNSDQLRLLGSMRGSLNKLGHFTHQILDIAKIEAGMMEYQVAKADIQSIIKPAVEDALMMASHKEIAIDVQASPAPPVMVDSDKISMVFSNLLSNAIKYTEKQGKITVKVSPCNLGVRVSVQDTGVGIAEEELPQVFTKFYQAKNVTKGSSRGTGVGLALVKAHTEGQGGRVFATSKLGVGSTFSVELPAAGDNWQESHSDRRPIIEEKEPG